ncbi:hypothetical protein E1264_37420 [Actinomadura sp. KC216]|uniref:thiopeptide-type bacteriocin biosynthesis protein n=1 Tax=Actinomadura sp. KC216 TaxID=2530370 RepID=UPI001051CED4|nr:thiopeptide-type bacteriocin biosynthesis protein [Actinomadura sp. KC216]TDB77585.1 hypothetical protein E1264_37420 [Actinomadura sp. KC216]
MPDDQLSHRTNRAQPKRPADGTAKTALHDIDNSVAAVLAGVPLNHAAARGGLPPADLAHAVQTYRTAGRAALHARITGRSWLQTNIQFTAWDTAERIAATHLAPHLNALNEENLVTAWWFIRKAPCWRMRILPTPAAVIDVKTSFGTVLDRLLAEGAIERWSEAIYEPESAAFGGASAIEFAHNLFHADSRSILDQVLRSTTPGQSALGRRELSILLCSALLHGARQDWYEQGDIWHRITHLRPLAADIPLHRLREMACHLRVLMTAQTPTTNVLFAPDQPLAAIVPWITAFDHAGRALAESADQGCLERGLRDVLAHHMIFHWNRLGLSARTQSILARAARDTVLDQPYPTPDASAADGG